MYFALYWLGLRNIEKTIRDDIHSGNVEIYFLRPLGYLWQKIWIQLGEGLVPFITAALLSFLVNYFFVGLPTIDVSYGVWALGIVVIFFMSQTVTVLLFVLCGLAGFWIENSEPLYFVVSKLIMVFGGAWVPVAFFPKAVQIVAEFSPFGASASVIYAMYPNFSQHFVVMCLNMIGWSMILVIITYVVSRRAYRNMAVNG
jgi:ABC-2 type transport system permease protein